MSEPTQLGREELINLQSKISASAALDQADFTALFDHIQAQTNELAEIAALNDRMDRILNSTVVALKGEPAPQTLHSWHDLHEVATAWKDRAETAECFTVAHPCAIGHEDPYDFNTCTTHDQSFAMDGDCSYRGKSVVETLEDEVSAQRFRAIQAEDKLSAQPAD